MDYMYVCYVGMIVYMYACVMINVCVMHSEATSEFKLLVSLGRGPASL
jgi:hypothetical protein